MNTKAQSQTMKLIQPLKQSASMILFQNPYKPNKLLMFKRIAKISFGNAVVFPGGSCDQQDKQQIFKYTKNTKFQVYSKLSAIRQLLQETGILLLPYKDINLINKLKTEQIKIQNMGYQFLCQLWKDSLHLIIPLIRFLTVQFIPNKRFDTIFFTHRPQVMRINMLKIKMQKLQQIQNLQQIKVSGQGQSYFWQSSQNVLQKCKQGQISLVPPQMIILNCLKNVSSINQLINLPFQSCAQPILMNTKDMKIFKIFGDYEYGFKQIINKQPQSDSRKNLLMYFASKIKEGENNKDQQKRLRRFEIDIKGKHFRFNSHLIQRSILVYIKNNPQI